MVCQRLNKSLINMKALIGVSQESLFYHLEKENIKNNKLIIFSDFIEAKSAFNYSKYYNLNVSLFPDIKKIDVHFDSYEDELRKAVPILENLIKGNHIVLISIDSIFENVMSIDGLKENKLILKTNDFIKIDEVEKMLSFNSFERVPVCYGRGEYCRRGDVLDMFLTDHELPIRISLFGDQIESIHYFDTITQRTIKDKKIDEIIIRRINMNYKKLKKVSILHYLSASSEIYFSNKVYLLSKGVDEITTGYKTIVYSPIDFNFKGKKTFILDDDERTTRLNEIAELEKKQKLKEATERQKKHKDFNDIFSNIKEGDYVVHEDYGIGKYEAIVKLETSDYIEREYIKIKYYGTEVLYVPPESAYKIEKYFNGDSDIVDIPLNRLGSKIWNNKKKKISEDVQKIAGELIKVYAERKETKGFACMKDTMFQKEFEDAFPYDETYDQLSAIKAVKKDMESNTPMDRLILGDVGYGKTEVAIRAVFKMIDNGKQVLFIAPTTILAMQHFRTFHERLSPFNIKVKPLTRFQRTSEQKETIRQLKYGEVDIVIGTHRMFSIDIMPKNIGLFIIDEEQRFGVMQKDKIKEKWSHIDILSLSATPIPRTLNMSLNGILDSSMITHPPKERLEIKTYASEFDEKALKFALENEFERNGQVFVITKKIRATNKYEEIISQLFKDKTIKTIHGSLEKANAEKIMIEFLEKKIDVLIGTTILESGIDVKNANTIIILDAEHFGLSTLYQLRGRVGRSNRQGFCYLFYKQNTVLSDASLKRIESVRRFTQFGAGFKIAMADMDIRGTGNLLGKAQSGHILSVGYDLYTKLISDEIRRLKGEKIKEKKDFETKIQLNVDTNIHEGYIDDENIKFSIYKKISLIENEKQKKELVIELKERFNYVPEAIENLLDISIIKNIAEQNNISLITEKGDEVIFSFRNEKDFKNWVNSQMFVDASNAFNDRISINIIGGYKINLKSKNKINDIKKLLT